MQARLKVLHDKANVKLVKLLPVTLIGRSTECNLKIASSQVSRAHCRITLGDDTVYVEDLGSANGTVVDGKTLVAHQPTSVVPGAKLVVGPAEFVIDYVASTSATMVLSRFAAPVVPGLSSTELLMPTKQESPALPTASPVAAPVAPAARVVKPVAMPVVAKPVVVAPVVPAAPAAVVPSALPVAAKAAPVAPHPVAEAPVAVPVELTFAGFASTIDEPVQDEATQFLFGAPDAFGDSSDSSSGPQTPAVGNKKGGLKSLFSLFGRKAKGSIESTAPTAAPFDSSSAPSVFLPTVNQDADEPSLAETDLNPAAFSLGDPAVIESTAETLTFEQPASTSAPAPAQAPADDEDGFQQFLNQL